jgi:hypothetical protein
MMRIILFTMVVCPLYAQGNGTAYPKITTNPLLFFLVPAARLKKKDEKRYHAKMRYIENATPHANVPNIWYVTTPLTEHGVPIGGEPSQNAPHVKRQTLPKTVRKAYHPAPVA